MTYYTYSHTPVGSILLIGDDSFLKAIYWTIYSRTPVPHDDWIEDGSKFQMVLTQLDEYFAGSRQNFDISLLAEGTEFQKRVWHELSTITYGETKSYKQIAQAIGMPNAARAVGAAIGRNPLSIVIPCHRVIAFNGALTGFAGGVNSKRMLLEHEGVLPKS